MNRTHDLLVLSDVHLGSDLIHHARPDAPARARASIRRDRELVAMLDWYREHPSARPWKLVIAGDFVDLVGMSVTPPEHLDLTDEERRHGLGGGAEHSVLKVKLVAEHHAAVFAALARFLAAGNALVVVRGNHDVDFHWEPVQRAFVRALLDHEPFGTRSVDFADWFYYEAGAVYIEHGHQYDRYCSYEHVMAPLSPRDPRKTSRSISDILLRYVVRPTRGLRESGHDALGVLDYIRFGARLGARGMAGLAARFFSAMLTLFAIRRAHFSDAAQWIREEHDRKLRLLAEAKQISADRLRALARLQRPPVTRSVVLILATVMLDRIVVGVLGLLLVGAVIQASGTWLQALVGSSLTAVAILVVATAWARKREAVDPSAELRERAPRVASLFPAAFVVMGHTHTPEMQRSTDESTTYVNLGAWAEEDAEGDSPLTLPATRTHLVVRGDADNLEAELLAWDADGPRRFFGYPDASTDGADVTWPSSRS